MLAASGGTQGRSIPAGMAGVVGLTAGPTSGPTVGLVAGLASGSVSGLAAGSVSDPRLNTAAHQFEAAMMQELLGPLTKQMEGMDGLTEDEDDDGGSNQALTSFASEALGEALSLHGGFGIADSVLKKLKREVAERGHGGEGMAKVSATAGTGQPKRNRPSVGNQNRISAKTGDE